MSENPPATDRETRLAAQLRANLRRRKAQARQVDARDDPDAGDPASLSKTPSAR